MTQIGEISLVAKIDTSRYKAGAKEIEQANKDIESSADSTERKSNLAFGKIARIGLAAVAAAAVAVGALIIKNIGAAIDRVDTLSNASRTFANMGFDANIANKSMERLKESILGLPTPLDSAVRGMTSLAATYGDIQLGQKVFTALNNAILGFGGTADMVSNAIMQLSQLPMDGPLDAQTWNSLRNSGLTPVLVAMSKDMGKSVSQMKEDFGDGTLTVEDFTKALINMNEKGGGGMKSLQEIAKDSTKGIGTSFANMNTAITRGLAKVITAIGTDKITNAITSIGNGFEKALVVIVPFVSYLANNEVVIASIAGVLGGVLVAALVGVGLAIGALISGPLLPIIAAFTALGVVAGLVKANWDKVKPTIDNVVTAFKTFWELIKPFREFVAGQFMAAWNDLRAAFDSLKQALAPFMPQLELLAKVVGIVLVAAIVLLVGSLVIMITGIARVTGWLATLWAKFVEGIGVVNRFVTGVNQVFRDLPGNILNAIGNLGGLLYNVGRDIVQGLINGIKSMVGAVGGAIQNVASSAVDKAKSALGIRSPSKVFSEIGKNIALGFAGGVDKYSGLATDAIGNLSGNVTVGSNLSGFDDVITRGSTQTNNSNITINIEGTFATSPTERRKVAEQIIEAFNQTQRARGGNL